MESLVKKLQEKLIETIYYIIKRAYDISSEVTIEYIKETIYDFLQPDPFVDIAHNYYDFQDQLNEQYDLGRYFTLIEIIDELVNDNDKVDTIIREAKNKAIKKLEEEVNKNMNKEEAKKEIEYEDLITYLTIEIEKTKSSILERFKNIFGREPKEHEKKILFEDETTNSRLYDDYTIVQLDEEARDKGYIQALTKFKKFIQNEKERL